MSEERRVYPYIPNSDPVTRAEMLREVGVKRVEDLLVDVPEELRMKEPMKLPEPMLSESELKDHVEGILNRNVTSREYLSFLGAGCYNHRVPAVVDEVIGRSEFLTAYAGEPYEDHGRFQALFEYQSMMAELLDFDVCNVPTYDGSQAAGTSLRMAGRITGRGKVLLAGNMNPDRKKLVTTYLDPVLSWETVEFDPETGEMDMDDLRSRLSGDVAAVYLETPNYLGVIEGKAADVAEAVHEAGGLLVAFVDPASLGVVSPPGAWGADIACGDIQSLGIHMNYGGGVGGFICTSGEKRFIEEYPSRLFGIAPTSEGEWGFGDVAWERTSFADRETAKEFVGTHAALWGIAAAVYLAAMGPTGMRELGQVIMQRCLYARHVLGNIPGVSTSRIAGAPFQEFVADFSETGMTVRQINEKLLERGIFGGRDLTDDFPGLSRCALYCVTETVTAADIDRLAETLGDILA